MFSFGRGVAGLGEYTPDYSSLLTYGGSGAAGIPTFGHKNSWVVLKPVMENLFLSVLDALQKRFGTTDTSVMTYAQRLDFFTWMDTYFSGARGQLPRDWEHGVAFAGTFMFTGGEAEHKYGTDGVGMMLPPGAVGKPLNDINPEFVVNAADWDFYRLFRCLVLGGYFAPVGSVWNSTYDNAILWRVAQSYADDFQLVDVKPPVNFPLAGWYQSGQEVRLMNDKNRALYRDALITNGKRLQANPLRRVITQAVYLRPRRDTDTSGDELLTKFFTGLSVLVAGGIAWSMVGGWAGVKAAGQNAFKQLAKTVTDPLTAAKNAITNPVGAVKEAAQQAVQREIGKVTGPLGRVYNLVTDPAGFVVDKVNNEILYPLKNPGEWVLDNAKKELRNAVTGEVRDAVTGIITGYLTPTGGVAPALPVGVAADVAGPGAVIAAPTKSGNGLAIALAVVSALSLLG